MTTKKQTQSKNQETPKKEAIDISQFVSNEESNIYAIAGLPEEFVATLFAWVSRSPKSFKEHLKEAVQEFDIKSSGEDQFRELSEKAKAFHEKWTVGYGHGSVSEHATVHVGLEEVSRKLSSDLELASPFLSITEYSQRYQKPTRGGWVNPYKTKKDKDAYNKMMNQVYTNFEKLIQILLKDKVENHKKEHGKNPTQRERAAYEKLAFEDARYVLPVSMHTQLGVTANARAWQDVVTSLEATDIPEYVEVASKLRDEISKVTPTLLRHTKPSPYQKGLVKKKAKLYKDLNEKYQSIRYAEVDEKNTTQVKTIQPLKSESYIVHYLYDLLVSQFTPLAFSPDGVLSTSEKEKTDAIVSLVEDLDFFDQLDYIFKMVPIQFQLEVSEANWHQLLRHNRSTHFNASEYQAKVITPPAVTSSEEGKELFDKTVELITTFREENKVEEANAYLIPNAQMLRVDVTTNLWALYHLINLRTSDEAQWEIKETFEKVYEKLSTVYPNLLKTAKRRN